MKRPASNQSRQQSAQSILKARLLAASASEAGSFVDAAVESKVEVAVRHFEMSLLDTPEIDDESREELSARFRAAAEVAAVDNHEANLPQRSDWLAAVDSLRKSGAVSDEDSHTLVRELEEAMQPLQRRDVQSAIEFSRRLTEEGEAAALEWLRRQHEDTTVSVGSTGAVDESRKQPTKEDVTKSKSRRLRGPPG